MPSRNGENLRTADWELRNDGKIAWLDENGDEHTHDLPEGTDLEFGDYAYLSKRGIKMPGKMPFLRVRPGTTCQLCEDKPATDIDHVVLKIRNNNGEFEYWAVIRCVCCTSCNFWMGSFDRVVRSKSETIQRTLY